MIESVVLWVVDAHHLPGALYEPPSILRPLHAFRAIPRFLLHENGVIVVPICPRGIGAAYNGRDGVIAIIIRLALNVDEVAAVEQIPCVVGELPALID